MKKIPLILFISLISFSFNKHERWVKILTTANGDIYFFDKLRMQKKNNFVLVWSRVKYSSSVMGAWSYQRLIKIDCTENTETTLQDTFFTDKFWTIPAMATNKKERPKVGINPGSYADKLTEIMCN